MVFVELQNHTVHSQLQSDVSFLRQTIEYRQQSKTHFSCYRINIDWIPADIICSTQHSKLLSDSFTYCSLCQPSGKSQNVIFFPVI